MVLPLLILLVGLQDNSQQAAELNRLQQEVQRLSGELNQTQKLLRDELRPMCSSESQFQAGVLRVVDTVTPVRANLFSMVSTPQDTCLPAEIRVTATFFDPTGNFVCSGTLAISQTAHIENTLFEFRPYQPENFLNWWDGPTLRQQILVCRDYKGDELRNPTDYATSLRIFATVFARRGGLSTSEIQLNLPRLQRP